MEQKGKPIRPKKNNIQLMFNTHDPLAEEHRAARAEEEDYFRKRDQELLVTLREKSAAEIEQSHSALYTHALPTVWRAIRHYRR